jgi:hypothetical protein
VIPTLVLALVALDAGIGVPPWPLSPDGDAVAVFDDVPLQAEGATVERAVGRVWIVRPEPGRGVVLLKAGGQSTSVPVAAAPGRIRVTFEPAAPVKGRDRSVRILLEVLDRAGAALALAQPPSVSASTGRLGPVAPAGAAGRYEATWQPADSPQPEVLGVVAIAPRCPLCATPLADGVARLPVAAAIELPGKSDPGVLTRVEIAGRTWGPVRADAEGRFSLPVVVPPGARWGLATSQSAVGNERRTKLDLGLSDEPGLHCASWPALLPADGRSEAGIRCVGWSADGGEAALGGLRAAAGRGAISSPSLDGGGWRARYRAPRGGAGVDRVTVEAKGSSRAKAEATVTLAPGPPASIEWRAEGEPAVPGERIRVSAIALDAWGDRLGDATSPDAVIEAGSLRIQPALGDGAQRLRLRYASPPGGPAASLGLTRDGDAWLASARDAAARPVAGVRLRFGSGLEAVSDSGGAARAPAKGAMETVEGPDGLRAVAWGSAPASAPPLEVGREVRIALRPPGSVDVDAVVEGGWLRWRVRAPDGSALAGRDVRIVSEKVVLGPVERLEDGGRCAIRSGKGTVAVVDEESGATALVELR